MGASVARVAVTHTCSCVRDSRPFIFHPSPPVPTFHSTVFLVSYGELRVPIPISML